MGDDETEHNETEHETAARNRYEERVEAKRERYAERADKARREAASAERSARVIMDGIPMGQPILVGHHSEKRHRRDLERIDRGLRKSVEASEKAAYYDHKAETYGTHGVSSDDPAAVVKLREQLAVLEANRELEKKANASLRKLAKQRAKDLGRDLTRADHCEIIAAAVTAGEMPESIGVQLVRYAQAFPWLPQFGNHTQANIKRIEKRIAELTSKAAQEEREVRGEGYSVEWNKLDNRVQIYFVDKPSPEKIATLKSHGFRWARSIAAWQRHASEGAWYHALRIVGHAREGEGNG